MVKKTICLLMALILAAVAGCSASQTDPAAEDENAYGIKAYYIYDSGLSVPRSPLSSETVYIDEPDNVEAAIDELFALLRSPKNSGSTSSIPDSVTVKSSLEGDTLTVDFSIGFMVMPRFDQVLTVSAVCLTMLQLPQITFVKVKCDGDMIEPFGDAHFTEDSFILRDDVGAVDIVPVTLYYVDNGRKLTVEVVNISIETQALSAPSVIYLLMQTPSGSQLKPPLSGNATVNSITISGKICSLDIDLPVSVRPAIIDIYSIVNTLCDNTDVDGVLITFNGMKPSDWNIFGCDGVLTADPSYTLSK